MEDIRPTQFRLMNYAMALLAVSLATLLRSVLDPLLGERQPFAFYYVAIAFSAFYGGFGPASLALIVSYFVGDTLFLAENHRLIFADPHSDTIAAAGSFVAISGALIFMTVRLKRTEAQAREQTGLSKARGTELRHAMERGRESQEKAVREAALTAHIVESLPGLFYVFDAHGKFLRWNTALETITGYTPEEVARKHPLEFFDAGDRELVEERIGKVFTEGKSFVEAQLLTKSGKRIVCFFTGRLAQVDGVACCVGMGMDISERKKTELALREGETRLRSIVDNTPAIVYIKERGGRLQMVNGAYAELVQKPREEIVGKMEAESFPPAVSDAFAKNDALVWRTGQSLTVEEAMPGQEGFRIFLSTKFPLRGLNGDIYAICGISTDITERKRTEAALKKSETYARAVVATAIDGIITMDDQGLIEDANPAAEKIFGYTLKELIGQNVKMLMPEPFRGEHDSYLESYHRTGNRRIVGIGREVQGRRKNGSVFPLDLSVAEAHVDDKKLYVGLLRDISARKDAERALRQTLELQRLILENAKDEAIITLDERGRITSWNQGAENIFQYSREEAMGQDVAILFTPEDKQQEVPQAELALAVTQGAAFGDRWLVRKNGEQFYATCAVRPLGSSGTIRGFLKIARDITERKRMEDELRKSRENLETAIAKRTAELRETVAELEAFSYSLSHDMRAPLRSMRSFSQVLVEDFADKLGEDGRNYLMRINNSAGRLDRLTQDILSYSRLLRENLVLHPVNVEQLVKQIVEERPNLQSVHAEIRVESPLLEVFGHEAALTQCLSNLMENAVKFVPKGRRPVIHISTEAIGEEVRIKVSDNGIGIAREHLDRIFGLFQRLHNEKHFQGTGIGLTIVRKAAERMGGKVGVDSELDVGSTFWVQLRKA